MPKNVPVNRVRKYRKDQGLTLEQLAERVSHYLGKTVHFTTIAKIERSMRNVSGEMLSAISEALDVNPFDLVHDTPPRIAVRAIPIVGTIPAGNWREAVAEPLGHITVPVGGVNCFALRPEGDSMDMVVGDDAYIVVDPDQQDLMDGKLYAIMNGDAETTFKRFRQEPPRFEPVSRNPIHKPLLVGREPFTVIGRVIWQGSIL